MRGKMSTAHRLTASIFTIIALTVGLAITSSALIVVAVSSDMYLFGTGKVDINLNDGKPVIEKHDFLFEPGMTVSKSFFVENRSTWDVYYKLYFNNISGDMADILQVTISSEDKILYSGTAADLTVDKVLSTDSPLKTNEKRNLIITFHLPAFAENISQNSKLSFDFCADAVQTKNNPNRIF